MKLLRHRNFFLQTNEMCYVFFILKMSLKIICVSLLSKNKTNIFNFILQIFLIDTDFLTISALKSLFLLSALIFSNPDEILPISSWRCLVKLNTKLSLKCDCMYDRVRHDHDHVHVYHVVEHSLTLHRRWIELWKLRKIS